jgi:tol-pal system protein YbgF
LRYIAIILIGNVSLLNISFAASSYDRKQNSAINKLKKEVRILKNKITNNQLGSLLQQNEQLRIDNQELRGMVETLQYKLKQNEDRQRNLYNDLNKRLKQLEGKTINSKNNININTPKNDDKIKKVYNSAFLLLKKKKYDKAINAFEDFLIKYRKSEYADNAQYWLAESHYAISEYQLALDEFLNLVEDYPNSNKILDAKLKIAYCYKKLGFNKEAKTKLKHIIDSYPNTKVATIAKKELKVF